MGAKEGCNAVRHPDFLQYWQSATTKCGERAPAADDEYLLQCARGKCDSGQLEKFQKTPRVEVWSVSKW